MSNNAQRLEVLTQLMAEGGKGASFEFTDENVMTNIFKAPDAPAAEMPGGLVSTSWTGAIALARLSGELSPALSAKIVRTAALMAAAARDIVTGKREMTGGEVIEFLND